MNETEDRFLVSEVCYKLGSRTYIWNMASTWTNELNLSLLFDTAFDILSHGQGVKNFILYLWIVLSCTTNFSWLSHNVYYIILHQVQLRFTVNFMFEMRGHCHEAMTVKIFQGAHKSSTSKSPFLYNSNILFWISKNKWSGHYEP